MKKRILAVLAALCLSLPLLLSSCGGGKPAVYQIGNMTVTSGMYNYYYACYKYLYLASATAGKNGIPDTEEGWNRRLNEDSDKTHAEAFNEYVSYRIKELLTAAYIYENSSKPVSSPNIQGVLQSVIDTTFYYTGASTKDQYSALLAAYGADYNDMFRALLYEYEYDLLYTGLFGQGGQGVLTDPAFAEDVERFYNENYIRIRYLIVETGDLRETEKKNAAMAAVTDEAFDSVLTTYAKDQSTNMFYYIYGYYQEDKEYLKAVYETEVGETNSIVIDGTTYIFRRYATGKEYEKEEYADYFKDFASLASQYAYGAYLEDYSDQIAVMLTSVYNPWDRKTCKEENAIDIYR